MSDTVQREELPEGRVRLAADGCSFTYERPRAGLLFVTIAGRDHGQFGTRTLDEIATALRRERPLALFIDAHEALGATVSVSDEWMRFFVANRDDLTSVSVLVGSRAVYLTIAIAQHLSRTGKLIQIYSDPELFKARLENASA